MRVAVSQFATTLDVEENLATCLRMINKVAMCQPGVIVLPEFCNTLFCHTQGGYNDRNQAWHQALAIDGPFLLAIAEQAHKHHCYIVINVTLRRDSLGDFSPEQHNDVINENISITSCLFSPLGELVLHVDKQRLLGHENDFFINTSRVSELASTTFGKFGLLVGNDTMTFKPSRELALQGGQLLCNSISTFARDQSHFHDPARACENKVFLATANKIGALSSTNSLAGVGQSQIISPEGKVLAKINHNEEGFVFADIDLANTAIAPQNKRRPDGTDLFKQRRPELYQALTLPIKKEAHAQYINDDNVPETANVAIFATYKSNEQAIEDVCFYIENNLSDIIQLPELFFIADKTITNNTEQLADIAALSKQLIIQISSVLRPFQYVCTSLVIDGAHQAVLISEQGLFATQQQLHFCQRYHWTPLGDALTLVELPLEQGNIKLAMLTADDASIPEIVNVAALNHVHLLLVPFEIQEPGEVEYCLLSRAAENRICILAASLEQSFAAGCLSVDLPSDNVNKNANKKKAKLQKSTGFIANLCSGSTLISESQLAKFTGYINQPLVKHQQGKITKALVHPIATCTKYE
ncbi:nitrilase-related carbon-nitrogen hydrolase [Colwellia hornerae]|uniref:Carbon-nitrogen hydrolase n=1 Tax=Colwellia hornerae TaxID=89402 RepID=A0A5C6Q2V5_9GAMM|nr:nitrilase-related carbon-nitrogen hydrolase [Colwellia hornerae]TWX52584.1 carbon-nitrogen hydrolase [Colwellia hornerae]TWX58347.1 carbon-nitrogen hydrolase [Colwellia hornerae]TWX63163.1 carbon-nitrogen hydrolase [Colwellia hornerae]